MMVSNWGRASPPSALYRLSRDRPVSFAIWVIPRAFATTPIERSSWSKFSVSKASVRYAAMSSSVSRYSAASKGFDFFCHGVIPCTQTLSLLLLRYRDPGLLWSRPRFDTATSITL